MPWLLPGESSCENTSAGTALKQWWPGGPGLGVSSSSSLPRCTLGPPTPAQPCVEGVTNPRHSKVPTQACVTSRALEVHSVLKQRTDVQIIGSRGNYAGEFRADLCKQVHQPTEKGRVF